MRRRLPPSRTERVIAAARIILAGSSLFAVWLDPAEPPRYVTATYSLLLVYVGYSIGLALLVWRRPAVAPLALLTHMVDIAMFSVLQFLTLGPSSPFFTYFIFSLFCGELRWGWRGTLATAIVVVLSYLTMGLSMSRTLGPVGFELNRFIIRTVYLCVATMLLVYLGQHEIRLRREIDRLARWPSPAGSNRHDALRRIVEHAAEIVGARCALVAWEIEESPWLHVASWSGSELAVTKHASSAFGPLVPPDLTRAIILCTTPLTDSTTALVTIGEHSSEWRGLPVHPDLLPRLGPSDLASAPFRSERVAGRVFFSALDGPSSEVVALTEVVAREIAASLDQLELSEQLRESAASEQRVQVARDLHDGVLQSLTGIRFELQTIATSLPEREATRDRLLAIERALTIEQRELRLFIDDLKTSVDGPGAGETLAGRLSALRERIALEWKVPVAMRVAPHTIQLPEEVEQAAPLMVHEAIVNALKHAAPTRISVDVAVDADRLHIVVSDDGCGFPFRGRYEHGELMRANMGPASLRERAASLGGAMAIESTAAGSRLEIELPVELAPDRQRASG